MLLAAEEVESRNLLVLVTKVMFVGFSTFIGVTQAC